MKIPERILSRILLGMGSAGIALTAACSPTVSSPVSTVNMNGPGRPAPAPIAKASVNKPELDNKECPSMILRAANATPLPMPRARRSCEGCGMG